MRMTIKNVSLFAASLLTLVLLPQAAVATTAANCPVEPKTGQAIASGDVYAGTNCTLHTPGDVDTFVFTADAGQTWQLVLAYQGGQSNVCITLYDPTNKQIFPSTAHPTNCTANGSYQDIVDAQTLTATGQYTIAVTEPPGNGPAVSPYALSLERIVPFPADGVPIKIGTAVSAAITPPTDQTPYIFYGATTGVYELTLTYAGGSRNACMYLYAPGSATAAPSPDQGCTANGSSQSYSFKFTPTKSETYMVLVNAQGNDGTSDYEFEISCLLGSCPVLFPTTTTLSSSPNPSADGQAVTFTAVVSSPDGPPPNGEIISFMHGATKLGTGTLSGGKATFSDAKLTPGATTAVTAVYAGDANLLGSTSNAVQQVVYGPCTLTDSLSYTAASKTLTMKFTVGNIVATTWNAWLIDANTAQELFSVAQPITDLPETVTKTSSVAVAGRVGVLSTLTTPTIGIYCSSYTQISTGTP